MAGYYPDGKGKPGRKPKFRPRITRIKLNPEQAVLFCNCYNTNREFTGGWGWHTYWSTSIPPQPKIFACTSDAWPNKQVVTVMRREIFSPGYLREGSNTSS